MFSYVNVANVIYRGRKSTELVPDFSELAVSREGLLGPGQLGVTDEFCKRMAMTGIAGKNGAANELYRDRGLRPVAYNALATARWSQGGPFEWLTVLPLGLTDSSSDSSKCPTPTKLIQPLQSVRMLDWVGQ